MHKFTSCAKQPLRHIHKSNSISVNTDVKRERERERERERLMRESMYPNKNLFKSNFHNVLRSELSVPDSQPSPTQYESCDSMCQIRKMFSLFGTLSHKQSRGRDFRSYRNYPNRYLKWFIVSFDAGENLETVTHTSELPSQRMQNQCKKLKSGLLLPHHHLHVTLV